MDKQFAVRRVRQRDLDRILEIERASFGADAYDRNLFAEYTRKCGGLFLVAERGNTVCGYSIAAISPGRIVNRVMDGTAVMIPIHEASIPTAFSHTGKNGR